MLLDRDDSIAHREQRLGDRTGPRTYVDDEGARWQSKVSNESSRKGAIERVPTPGLRAHGRAPS
jgi:hypothetical protein